MSVILKLKHPSATRILRGQDHYWRVMQDEQSAGRTFGATSIHRQSSADRGSIRKYLRQLLAGGWIEVASEAPRDSGRTPELLYRVVRPQSSAPIVGKEGSGNQGRAQQQMWNVMRRQREGWTARSLAADASTDEVIISRATALSYSRRLQDADMLATIEPGGPGKERRWRLKGSADTGPKPPMVLRSRMIFDQNTSTIVGLIEAEQVMS